MDKTNLFNNGVNCVDSEYLTIKSICPVCGKTRNRSVLKTSYNGVEFLNGRLTQIDYTCTAFGEKCIK